MLRDPRESEIKTEASTHIFVHIFLLFQISAIMDILDIVPPGVITGDDVLRVFQYAEDNNFAIPSINVTSTRYSCVR